MRMGAEADVIRAAGIQDNEITFDPLVKWWKDGLISPQLRAFVWSSAPVHCKIRCRHPYPSSAASTCTPSRSSSPAQLSSPASETRSTLFASIPLAVMAVAEEPAPDFSDTHAHLLHHPGHPAIL
ncbi:hypothetical protein D9615_010638 [Tricholomella constricta]|uniref:Uncharacterized protein n=1 Tax=Tricholomella constricta TaxID=117010 RepID=A0A8H5GKM6_9AGAR|nr:hypothetical protein D9615_010638 [Tricholomella constricta]